MKLTISPRAEKQLKKLPKSDQIAIARKVRQLVGGQPQTNLKKLKGYSNIFRLRLSSYRIVFRHVKDEIYIIFVGHRRDIYRLLKQMLD